MTNHHSANPPAPASPALVVVVPCFNEARRLDLRAFESFAAGAPDTQFLFVDDGSTDGTRTILEEASHANPSSFRVLDLDHNRGKGEAVRLGVLQAARAGPAFVGFWDADLATPLAELPRFRAVFDERPETVFVLGSRVNLLGRSVHRKLTRHYVGRVFATAVAAALHLPVYDTQCGAKVFRCTPDVLALFERPFFSEWIFDAEILARAIDARGEEGAHELSRIAFELPLMQWEDVDGSTVSVGHFVAAIRDAFRIYGRHLTFTRWYRGTRGQSARVAGMVRSQLSRLSTDRSRVSMVDRTWRGALSIPVFGALLVWMRARAWLLGPLEMPATTRLGSHFTCRLPDFIQTYLYLFGVWEPDITSFIRRRLGPGDTFVDVGANIGYHSLVANGAVGCDGRVVAIEASPAIYERLEMSLVANGSPACVRTVNQAASDTHGEVVIYRGPLRNVGLSTTVAGRGFAEEAKVACAPWPTCRRRLSSTPLDSSRSTSKEARLRFCAAWRPSSRSVRVTSRSLVELSPTWWTDKSLTPREVLQPLLDAGFHVYRIDNDLWPWRYLWSNDVKPPKRLRRNLGRRVKRLDLVLSRVDAETL